MLRLILWKGKVNLKQGNDLITFLFLLISRYLSRWLYLAYCDFFSMVMYKHDLQWPNSYKHNKRQNSVI